MIDISIQSWFIFALLSAVTLGVTELLQQKILNSKIKVEKFSAIESGFFVILIQFIIFTPLIIAFLPGEINIFSQVDTKILWLVVLSGVIGWPASYFYLKSFEVKNISLSTIFSSISMVTSVFLGYLFLGEAIYTLKIMGFIFVILAIVLVSLKAVTLEKNHFYGLLGGVLFGFEYTIDSVVLDWINPVILIFWQYLFILIVAFLFHSKIIINKLRQTKIKRYQIMLISAIGYFFFNVLFFYAFHFGGEAGKTDAVSGFNIFMIIMFEYFILKHKTDFWLKIISFVLALVGVVLLGISAVDILLWLFS